MASFASAKGPSTTRSPRAPETPDPSAPTDGRAAISPALPAPEPRRSIAARAVAALGRHRFVAFGLTSRGKNQTGRERSLTPWKTSQSRPSISPNHANRIKPPPKHRFPVIAAAALPQPPARPRDPATRATIAPGAVDEVSPLTPSTAGDAARWRDVFAPPRGERRKAEASRSALERLLHSERRAASTRRRGEDIHRDAVPRSRRASS